MHGWHIRLFRRNLTSEQVFADRNWWFALGEFVVIVVWKDAQ
jgi:hypothetical protein